MRKPVIILLVLISVSLFALLALAQDAPQPPDPRENWCWPGGPWGPDACRHEDPDIQDYLWRAGWCYAALADGRVQGDFYDCMMEARPTPTPTPKPSNEGEGGQTQIDPPR